MSMNTAPPRGQVPLPGCRGFRSLLAWAVLWGTVLPLHVVSGQCALPSGLQGRWLRASDGLAVTLTSSGLEGHLLTVGSTSYDRFVCAASNGADVFVFRLENEVDGMIGKVMGFFCWNLKKVTASTYLLYQLTPIATEGSFANDRAVAGQKESVPPLTDVCLTEPASLHPTLLLTLPSDAADVGADTIKMAGQQCPPEVFATYTYTKDGTGCTGTDSRLDFCEDRETARVNYTACDVRVLFSESGNLSCAASFTLAGTVFILLVNHDDSVDNTNYFRVVCLKMERDGESEKAVVYPRDCTATTGSHSLALSRTSRCLSPLLMCSPPNSPSPVIFLSPNILPCYRDNDTEKYEGLVRRAHFQNRL
ncbi:uncharacterized protein LOC143298598 [Babylonia areolata]|uniref:uncharacterized protein LOC143298598 n=1 Tax=Babylonia areolata TaxID=304850 RepID=UPI003FD59975